MNNRERQSFRTISAAFFFAVAMSLLIAAVPSWDQTVTDAWSWILNFKGIWQ